MIIQKNFNNTNFQGIHIANTKSCLKNLETQIKIYELNAKDDKTFLKKLPQKINMKNLMPDLLLQEYYRWQEMLEYAVDKSMGNDRKTLLAVTDNKPCGLAVYLPGKNKYHLDCICTWPVEYGKKVKLAGSTLFQQLFKDFAASKANKIKLEAIINGPYDTVSKYKKLGFKEYGGEANKIFMDISAQKVKESLSNLKQLISCTEIQNKSKINLNEILL